MSNTIPDEKVTVTFIGYLAIRLLDISRYKTLNYIINERVSGQNSSTTGFLVFPVVAHEMNNVKISFNGQGGS
jgi:hypothetical protein